MGIFDVVLLIILGCFALFGLWFGLIHTLGALVGTIIGALAAGYYYDGWAQYLSAAFGGGLNVWRVIVFLVIFTVVNRLIGLVFYILERIFRIVSIIPFLKSINRLAGGILGFIEGALVIGLTLYFAGHYPLGSWFEAMVSGSKFAPYFLKVASILTPFLPQALKTLQTWLPWAFIK